MAEQKMGFEGLVYTGTANAEATTPIPETRDMAYTLDLDYGDTTARSPDGSLPIETGEPTCRKWSFDFQALNVPGDAVVAGLIAASFAGTVIALRTKDFVSGKGYNGDVTLTHKLGMSLKGEQTLDFTAKPSRRHRMPVLYV